MDEDGGHGSHTATEEERSHESVEPLASRVSPSTRITAPREDVARLFLGVALLAGGYETTPHQIISMVYTLLTHDKQLRQLKARR
jgi:hypothetical protein